MLAAGTAGTGVVDMELRNLKTFQSAAELLNFTKAAKALNLSQPAVTAQIRALEKEIGHPLFFRIGKQTFLTTYGITVKQYADRVFLLIEDMERELSQKNQSDNSRLVIAASETFCTHYFPPIIRKYLSEFPDAGIKLVSRYSNEVISGIDQNEFDIGIITGTYRKSGITNVVISEQEDLILVVSKKLYNKYSSEEILSRIPFIRYEIAGPFQLQMQQYMQEAGAQPNHIIESSSLEAVKSAVLNDIGTGLISRNLVSKELRDGLLIEIRLNKKPVKIKTSLIIATSKLSHPGTLRLIQLIEKNWNTIHETGT